MKITCDKNCPKCKFYLKIYDGYFESYRCIQNIKNDLDLIKNRHEK